MIDQHALEDPVDILLVQSLFDGLCGQFYRICHLSQGLLDLSVPDLFLCVQTLVCKTRASLL